MDKRVKVGIIGIGHVGTHVLYSLVDQGVADEIVLIDSNQAKAKSEAQDVFDAQIYHKHKTDVYVGDFQDLKDCDVLIHCAGKITLLIESQNRDSELFFTTEMVRSYIPKIKESGFNGILINITNPCDVITEEFAKGLQLPPGHIFGTCTGRTMKFVIMKTLTIQMIRSFKNENTSLLAEGSFFLLEGSSFGFAFFCFSALISGFVKRS